MKKQIRIVGIASLALGAALVIAQSAAPPKAVVGAEAPAFTLVDSNGKSHNLADFKGKYVVLEWTNHLCPIVVGHYRNGGMQKTQKWATDKKVVWLSVVSSAPGKQGHVNGDEANAVIKDKGHNISAMLLDRDGKVGRAYGAKTTPHMYVISPDGKLIYNGAIDDKGSRNHVVAALEDAWAGRAVAVPTSQPYGCSVKY